MATNPILISRAECPVCSKQMSNIKPMPIFCKKLRWLTKGAKQKLWSYFNATFSWLLKWTEHLNRVPFQILIVHSFKWVLELNWRNLSTPKWETKDLVQMMQVLGFTLMASSDGRWDPKNLNRQTPEVLWVQDGDIQCEPNSWLLCGALRGNKAKAEGNFW